MRDLVLDENMDLLIINGDFVISESTKQNQKILILADKGEFKESPMRGVGSRRYLEDPKPDNLAREIRQEFTTDGMVVEKINITDDFTIQIVANY